MGIKEWVVPQDKVFFDLFDRMARTVVSAADMLVEFIENFEKIENIEDPREKLIVFCDNHLNMVESDRALAEVIQVELRQSNKFMREYKNKHFLAYLNIIADIIAQGQEQGIFRLDVKPDIFARVIFGSLDELSTYLVTARRKRFDVHEVATMVGNSFINGLVKR